MKKRSLPFYAIASALFVCICLGLFLSRTRPGSDPLLSPAPSGASLETVDLNRATASQLMGLPGIGPTLASRILQYRSTNGPFSSVAELLNIPGIGEDRLAGLLPYLTAGG